MKLGDTAFIIESNRIIREVEIVRNTEGFYLIRFKDSGGGIKVRENRLFLTKLRKICRSLYKSSTGCRMIICESCQ